MAEEKLKDLRDAQLNSYFRDSGDGKIYKRTTASGTFVFVGASQIIRHKEITLQTNSWTELRFDGDYNRVAFSVQNKSSDDPNGAETIILSGDNTTPLSQVGFRLEPSETREYTGTEAKLYAKSTVSDNYKVTYEDMI